MWVYVTFRFLIVLYVNTRENVKCSCKGRRAGERLFIRILKALGFFSFRDIFPLIYNN